MARRLTQREIRMLQLGAVAAVAILALTKGMDGIEHWSKVRTSLRAARDKMADLGADDTKRAGLLSIVPVFEPPQPEETQKFLFRDKLHEQLKKAGIKNEPLAFLSTRRTTRVSKEVADQVLRIKCKGKCKFGQLLDFLAALKENPFLVGVEELSFECDTKKPPDKRQDIEFDLVVSTFVKQPNAPGGER